MAEKQTVNCLKILSDGGTDTSLSMVKSSKTRPLSGSKAPPIRQTSSAGSLRTLTPTKQISLQAVRRKEECESFNTETGKPPTPPVTTPPSTTTGKAVKSELKVGAGDTISQQNGASRHTTATNGVHDDSESESSDTDDEPIRAPNELMMEFLDCVMHSDYINAQKLCKMILIYEPNNREALSFQPMIEQKIALGKVMSDEEDDSSSDDIENISESTEDSDESDSSDEAD